MAALPVGIFLMFALITVIISAVGFVFFEVFLLFIGGLTLLSVLSGIALFSLLVSVIVNALFITIPNLLKQYYPQLFTEKQSEGETSGAKEAKSDPGPDLAQLLNTRIGLYISRRPFLAFTLLLFSTMAALPVGIFLMFALITVIISAVGFVFFEVFLLFIGGLTLLSVLSGIALFSLLVSVIVNALFITIPNLLKQYYPQLFTEKQSEGETSGAKEAK
uniref:Transmembrane protein 159 n=1 Tax=Iconisemion striatum TaxID=60296 RepID=A0A1A7Y5X7_9TELE